MSTGRRVLIVDDDEGVRTAVTWALEAEGFSVHAVDNGLAAMDAITERALELAAKEFELLAYLVDHPQRACSRSELLTAVWSSSAGWQTEATVTEHVYRIRQKIEADPQAPRWLRTVRAIGYRWEG